MSPDDLNRHQIERLAFIRYLFTLGVQHAQGAGPQSSVAILLFHDAVELFLVLASEALHVKRADSFMNYFQPLDEKLKPGPPMPERESMRRLNDARNALKHKGLRADRADLEHHTEAVIRFFEEATPRIFGADIDSVSLVAVVRCESAQPYLQAAELAYGEHRATDGSRACAEALDEVLRDYEQRQSDRWLESPFSPRHRLRAVRLTKERSGVGREVERMHKGAEQDGDRSTRENAVAQPWRGLPTVREIPAVDAPRASRSWGITSCDWQSTRHHDG